MSKPQAVLIAVICLSTESMKRKIVYGVISQTECDSVYVKETVGVM